MTNLFLKVNKDLFKLGLNPTQIFIVAQVMEYNNNTGDCFISDKTLAEMLNVSVSTISREMKKVEELGFISRSTKNIKGGKERHITINIEAIENALTISKLPSDNKQNDYCTMGKMPNVNKQNDLRKDNSEEDNERENNKNTLASSPSGEESIVPVAEQVGEIKAYELSQIDTCNYTYVEDDVIQVLNTGKLLRVIGGKAVSASA